MRTPFLCGSWRCRRCAAWRGAVDFRRCAQGVTARSWWVYVVLTFDPAVGADQWDAYRMVGKMWDEHLRQSIRSRVGRFAYLQTWERTRSGWPHVNLLMTSDGLREWVESEGVSTRWNARAGRWSLLPSRWRSWMRSAAMRAGFGRVMWAEVIAPSSRESMAGYLCKLSTELVGAANKKGDQSPVQAPRHFRRFRASRGLLPATPKGSGTWTGALVPGRCVPTDEGPRTPGRRAEGVPMSWETVADIRRRVGKEAAELAARWEHDGQSFPVPLVRRDVHESVAANPAQSLEAPGEMVGGRGRVWTEADAVLEAERW
jgi:hypothetical protein